MSHPNSYYQSVIDGIGQLNETVTTDSYLNTIQKIIKSYNVSPKIKITTGKTKGDYNWKSDTINLRPNYKNLTEFVMSVLHETHHAMMRKKYGSKKYEQMYLMSGEMAVAAGGDFHDDNTFEEEAEKWAKKELSKWIKKNK